MLQQCKKHGNNFVHGTCLKCTLEDKRDMEIIVKLQSMFRKIPDYAETGAFSLAFKVHNWAKKAANMGRAVDVGRPRT